MTVMQSGCEQSDLHILIEPADVSGIQNTGGIVCDRVKK